MDSAAVSFSEGAVKSLLGKLGSILAEEASLLGGVRSEIQYIKDELESMDAFLHDLAMQEDQSKQVKTWMKQVREMAYDAEDCIDEFTHHIDKPCGKGILGFFNRTTRQLRSLKARHQIAKEVQELKKRAREVGERHSRYHMVAPRSDTLGSISSLPPHSQLLALYPDKDELVGIERRMGKVVGWLKDTNPSKLTVISIVGFGGLGKTTLAKCVYESSTVKSEYFDCRAFVVVSQNFELKVLMRDILRQIRQVSHKNVTLTTTEQTTQADHHEGNRDINQDPFQNRRLSGKESHANTQADKKDPLVDIEKWDAGQLTSKLREYLKNKRYVIVLDDIWTELARENLSVVLPDYNNGSKIIVTTRIETVAKRCSSDDYIYKIEPLNDAESEELFFKRVSGPTENFSDTFKEISKKILKKCGGMPLAITNIAGLLSSKPRNTEQWQKLHDALGSELETNPTLEGIKKILNLSYNHLPHYLKTCFLYLSVYPEDYKISRKSLVRRWISEGFISKKRGLSLEDVGEGYFYELVNRYLILPVDFSSTGKVKTCRVHDIMLELIVSKSIEENFVSFIGNELTTVLHDKVRRLSIHDLDAEYLMGSSCLSHARSLTIFGRVGNLFNSTQLRILRVLDLTGCEVLVDDHLKYICQLFRLKYLSLRGTNINMLSCQIGLLQDLETLDIRETRIEKLPINIVKLHNLVHLLCGEKWTRSVAIPHGINKMESIQTLGKISLIESRLVVHELGELTNLKKLGVVSFACNISEEESSSSTTAMFTSLLSALEKLSVCLRSLTIWFDDGSLNWLDELSSPPLFLQSLDLNGSFNNLPCWIALLSNLTKLNLRGSRVGEDTFQVFQKLPNLICLKLVELNFMLDELVIGGSGFPNLKLFVILRWQIPMLRFEEGAAPNLEKIRLESHELGGLSGMEHLKNLKEVALGSFPGASFEKIVNDVRVLADKQLNRFTVAVETWGPYWWESEDDPE